MAKKKASKNKWIVGGGIIVAAIIGISVLTIGGNVTYFYTPDEAVAKAAELTRTDIRVGGMVKQGTVNWQAKDLSLSFTLTDFKSHEIQIKHTGTPPDMFKEGQGVVVEGRIASDGTAITSKRLLVKHSEEYKKPGEDHYMDKELMEKSIFK